MRSEADDEFVGRRQDLAELKGLIDGNRLVTLVGPAGVGKSALADQASRRAARQYRVVTCELKPLTGDDVADAVADEFGFADISAASRLRLLQRHVNNLAEPTLLVLDNCEHVLEDATRVASSLLNAQSPLRILATSQQWLELEGEHRYGVAPLATPDPDSPSDLAPATWRRFDGIDLFVRRACAAGARHLAEAEKDPALRAQIAELVARLDGIPLALVLAAGMTPTLDIRTLLARLDKQRFKLLAAPRTGNRRGLADSLQVAYDTCSPAQQTLWQRLSAFPAGSFTLAAAERVCSDEQLPEDTLAFELHVLVGKSIVVRDASEGSPSPRYRLLQSIQEFGRLRREESGAQPDTLWHQMRGYYTALMQQAADSWFGLDEGGWLRYLREEKTNIAAVHAQCLHEGRVREAQSLATGVTRTRVLFFAGNIGAGVAQLLRSLDNEGSEPPSELHIRTVALACWMTSAHGSELASQLHSTLLSITSPREDPFAAYGDGAYNLLCLGDFSQAAESLGRAMALFTGYGQAYDGDRYMAHMLLSFAHAFAIGADPSAANVERARDTARSLLASAQQAGAPLSVAWGKWCVALAAACAGEAVAALEDARAALREIREVGARWGVEWSLLLLAWIYSELGQCELAAELLGATGRILADHEVDIAAMSGFSGAYDRAIALTTSALGSEKFIRLREQGARRSDEAIIARAVSGTTAKPAALPGDELTSAEQQVARLVTQGLSNKDIANKLVTSVRTTETHVSAVLRKLAIQRRGQIAWWVQHHPEAFGQARPQD